MDTFYWAFPNPRSLTKVPHQHLLLKTDYLGIRGRSQDRILDFFTSLTQQLVTERATTGWKYLRSVTRFCPWPLAFFSVSMISILTSRPRSDYLLTTPFFMTKSTMQLIAPGYTRTLMLRRSGAPSGKRGSVAQNVIYPPSATPTKKSPVIGIRVWRPLLGKVHKHHHCKSKQNYCLHLHRSQGLSQTGALTLLQRSCLPCAWAHLSSRILIKRTSPTPLKQSNAALPAG